MFLSMDINSLYDVFEKVRFDVILLETYKNTEQMHGIIQDVRNMNIFTKMESLLIMIS